MKDENYTGESCELIPQIREKYESWNDKRLVWELIKMEFRDHTVSFAKRKARATFKRETEISKQLEELDYKICNSDNLSNIDDILNEYENLKIEMQAIYEEKRRAAISDLNADGWRKESDRLNISSI